MNGLVLVADGHLAVVRERSHEQGNGSNIIELDETVVIILLTLNKIDWCHASTNAQTDSRNGCNSGYGYWYWRGCWLGM